MERNAPSGEPSSEAVAPTSDPDPTPDPGPAPTPDTDSASDPASDAPSTSEASPAAVAPGPGTAFVRFVLCGGGIGIASSFAVAMLAGWMPWALANAVITVVSTIIASELHARFTFGAGGRCGLRGHLQSAGTAAAAYVVTSAAIFILHTTQSAPSAMLEQIVYLSASALAGVGRFVVLRLFVFAAGKRHALAAAGPHLKKKGADVQVHVKVTDRGVEWSYTWETGEGSERITGEGSGLISGRTYGWKPVRDLAFDA